MNKIKKNCIYFLNANIISNYLGMTLYKNRPFICVDKRPIHQKDYFYFIAGTSKNNKERNVKVFNKFYVKIDHKNKLNKLNKNSYFQTNILYCIESSLLNNFSPKYQGKIKVSEVKKINDLYKESLDQETSAIMIYLSKFQKWFIGKTQSNFKYIASANNKNKKKFSTKISENIRLGKK